MDTKNVVSLWKKIVLPRRNNRMLSGFLSLLIFSSCETITEIDLPEEKPQLVINSIFNADSLIKVNLTQSQSVNNKSLNFKAVENASIEIFKNTTSLGFLEYKGKGNYFSAAKLPYEPNAAYSIKVKAAEFETAESKEAIPSKPIIGSLKIKPDFQNSGTAYKSYNVSFDLNDSPEGNYYFLRVWVVYSTGSKSPVYFNLYNNLGQFVPFGVAGWEMLVFDDHAFNGKTVNLILDIYQAYIGNEGDYTIRVELGSTSKSYYDYQFSIRKQVKGDPILNSSDFPVSNNIKKGLGIFAPYNAATLSFDVVR